MHLHDLLGWPGPMTHRQFLLWMAWLKKEWNKPSRDNWYSMQAAAEARKGWVAKPNDVQVSDFIIPFGWRTPEEVVEAEEQEVAHASDGSKAMFSAVVGVGVAAGGPGVTRVTITPEQFEEIERLPLADQIAMRRELARQQAQKDALKGKDGD